MTRARPNRWWDHDAPDLTVADLVAALICAGDAYCEDPLLRSPVSRPSGWVLVEEGA